MEMERTTTTPCCSKPNADNGPQQSNKKCTPDARPNAAPSVFFDFDCSICLDPAAEPVVTLCGHLYCWPCIYKWLNFGASTHRCCPVCKSPITVDSLVPLYGRGGSHESSGVPRPPPSVIKPTIREDEYDPFELSGSRFSTRPSVFRSTAGGVLGGMVAAMLPRLSGSGYYPRLYLLEGDEESARMRRREVAVGDSLHQLWVLLCCCAVFCLLFF